MSEIVRSKKRSFRGPFTECAQIVHNRINPYEGYCKPGYKAREGYK